MPANVPGTESYNATLNTALVSNVHQTFPKAPDPTELKFWYRLGTSHIVLKKMKKMNLFGYTYKIYDIGYKTEMMSKECNAGDPLETPGRLISRTTF